MTLRFEYFHALPHETDEARNERLAAYLEALHVREGWIPIQYTWKRREPLLRRVPATAEEVGTPETTWTGLAAEDRPDECEVLLRRGVE